MRPHCELQSVSLVWLQFTRGYSAREALSLLLIPKVRGDDADTQPVAAQSFFDEMEIYPGSIVFFVHACLSNLSPIQGSKITHFEQLHQKTGIPYTEMVRRSFA
jgi:magnesium-dependent phosphatase 1